MIAGREGVHIETLSNPEIAEVAHQPRLRAGEIAGLGHFHVAGVPLEYVDRRAGPFGHGGVVRHVVDPGGGGARMGVGDKLELERLRRLHRAQGCSGGRADDGAVGVDLLDRVCNRHAGRAGAMGARAGDRPTN